VEVAAEGGQPVGHSLQAGAVPGAGRVETAALAWHADVLRELTDATTGR
jgi:hypothetical protein